MNQADSEWKLVIKLDVTAIRIRVEQLQEYLKNMEKRCEKIIARNAQQICTNMVWILKKERKGDPTYRIARTVKNTIQFQYK